MFTTSNSLKKRKREQKHCLNLSANPLNMPSRYKIKKSLEISKLTW